MLECELQQPHEASAKTQADESSIIEVAANALHHQWEAKKEKQLAREARRRQKREERIAAREAAARAAAVEAGEVELLVAVDLVKCLC